MIRILPSLSTPLSLCQSPCPQFMRQNLSSGIRNLSLISQSEMVQGGAATPHPASCLSSHLLGPHLPGSPQQRLGWIWYQIGPVSVPAPGSSLYQLGFHWQQTPPSVHLDRQCILLLGPKQRTTCSEPGLKKSLVSSSGTGRQSTPSPFLKQ